MAIQTARRGPVAATRRRLVIPPVGLPVTSGLRGWWKADAITAAPADGGALASWTDSSPNSYHAVQATTANRPLYRTTGAFLPNSKPVVEFEASSSDYLLAPAPGNTATTRFMVVRWKVIGSSDLIHNANGYEFGPMDDGELALAAPGGWAVDPGINTGTPLSNGVWYVIAFVGNNSNSSAIYVDGNLYGTTSTIIHSVSSATANMSIGAAVDGQFPSDAYIAEVIDYNRVLTDTERTSVSDQLRTKYGFESAPDPVFLNFDFDGASEGAQLATRNSSWESSSAHQHAWITTPTRLGSGRSERFEIHNNTSDSGTGTYRSLLGVYDTNEGGVAGAQVAAGPSEVYWCWSSYLPTSGAGDANATVSSGFSQTQAPNYEHLFELHDRNEVLSPGGSTLALNEVANIAVMVRDNQLQFRGRMGTWTRSGASWISPSWGGPTPGTSGSNDQIPIPIVKPGGTNATIVMNAWIDIILHVRFAKNATGLVEVWARQAGQAFTSGPNLTINGPTHKVLTNDGPDRSTADVSPIYPTMTGVYMEIGLYNGSSSWGDSNGAHVHIADELRRHGTLAAAKANWGP